MKEFKFLIKFIITFLLFWGGTASLSAEDKANAFLGNDNAVSIKSDNGVYKLSLYSTKSPIPLKKIHDWVLKVERLDEKPMEKIIISVFGGMPIHQHDFPTKPVIEEVLGNGLYRVSGIKFNMPGLWEMRFSINENGNRDRGVFEIKMRY